MIGDKWPSDKQTPGTGTYSIWLNWGLNIWKKKNRGGSLKAEKTVPMAFYFPNPWPFHFSVRVVFLPVASFHFAHTPSVESANIIANDSLFIILYI